MAKQRLIFRFGVLLMACCLATSVLARPRAESAASGKAGDTFRDCAECPEMVTVPAGSFTLDGAGSKREIVIGRTFAVGKFEVTFDEWDACVAAGGCDAYRPADEGWGRGRRPVLNIAWDDAQRYLQWLSRKSGKRYRLLSEAEWEYAARAGLNQQPRGKAAGSASANCDECGSQWSNTQTMPVGSLKANAFGLHDMHGNVWEWVDGCFGCDCASHILRGAALGEGAALARTARRIRNSSNDRNGNAGLRVAADIGGSAAAIQPGGLAEVRGLLECDRQVIACPEPVKETVKTIFSDKPITIEGTHFDTDSAKLKPDADAKLNEVVAFAAKYPEARLDVSGHTDSSGAEGWNVKLSAARAEAVKAYLVDKGVAAERIAIQGEAATRPVADNKTVEGRARNRRVEINSVIKEEKKVSVTE